MTNIKLSNRWGAHLITCERHEAARSKHLLDQTGRETTDALCPDCENERRHAEAPAVMRAALLDPKCTHTRFRPFGDGGSGYVTCYHRDPTSPSGVKAAASLDSTRFDKLYNELRAEGLLSSSKSPLSPTEGL